MGKEIAIKTHALRKCYGTRVADDSIDLEVYDGELMALLGVNGAGKTTLIKMLSCLLKPTSGDAEIYGHNIVTDVDSVKRIINVSPQETSVAPNLTVRENIELMAQIYGATAKDSCATATELIQQFSLSENENTKAKRLSGGWQRRLSIAMALVSNPKLLFLDEPTLGLDVLARRELWEHIRGLKGKVTVILTTHYLEEAEALSDRIAIISKGKLKAIGTAAELIEITNEKNLEEAFVKLASE